LSSSSFAATSEPAPDAEFSASPGPSELGPSPPARLRRRWRPSILLVLLLGFGGLTVGAAGSVTLIGYAIAKRNTYDLIGTAARTAMDQQRTGFIATLEPAESAVRYLAGALSRGEVGANEPRLAQMMEGMVAAAPQLGLVAYVDADLDLIGAGRVLSGLRAGRRSVRVWPELRLAVREGESQSGLVWRGVTYVPSLNTSFVIVTQAVMRDRRYRGIAIAGVPITSLSRPAVAPTQPGTVDFMLRGAREVLAHPALAGGTRGLSPDHPVPRVGDIADPVLTAFENGEGEPIGPPLASTELEARRVGVNGEGYIVIYHPVTGYDSVPWRVGRYFPEAQAAKIMNRLTLALIAGGGVVMATLLFAILMSRMLAGGIGRLADAAHRVARLDFGKTAPLPGSMLAELDRAAKAFNAMRAGLSWFETYVPRALVKRLMRLGDVRELAPVERELTIMFTDIVGFSAIGQRLDPPRLAAFINRHFGMLAAAIEAEGGTVDKYIGDSVMAFWGAPAEDPKHALAIARRLKADNERRRRKGLNPVRLRIGIHTGLAIAGNIGAPGRINYTLIGDAVNMAQRVEQAGHEVDDGADTIVLASAATAAALPPEIERTGLGPRALKGLAGEHALYRLAVRE
jgi:adenylate cyclase